MVGGRALRPLWVCGLGASLFVFVGALPGRGADVSPPACRISVAAMPPRAFVGQQVVYTVRIARREDVSRITWEAPLVFPDFRSEWLPGRAERDASGEPGVAFWTREESRALFASRAGRLRIEGARVRCELAAPARERIAFDVPALEVDVREPPAEARPDDFAGAIGPLTLRARTDVTGVVLGGVVRVSLLVRGYGDLWSLPSPADAARWGAAVDVFPRAAEVKAEPGDRLYLRRFFRLDVVPREVGTLTVPGFRVPYYDPSTGRYGVAQTDPIAVAVTSAPAPAQRAPERAVPVRAQPGADPRSGRVALALRVALLAMLASGCLAGLALWRRRTRPQFAAATAAWREADAAQEPSAEAAALARALRLAEAALAGVSDTPARREAARQRQLLDAGRFSDGVVTVDGVAVRRALRALGVPAPGSRLGTSRK